MNNTIPIVLNSNSQYIDATYLTMWSILKKGSKNKLYYFYVFLSEDVNIEEKNLLLSLLKDFSNIQVDLIVFDDANINSNRLVGNRIPNVAYSRLFACDYINEEKCLYIDQDIYLNGDIAELYLFEIDNYLLAGVPDPSRIQHVKNLSKCFSEYEIKKYVNAGVLIMNLKKMRQKKWIEKIQELILLELPLGDQDVINLAAQDNLLYLPERYNLIREEFSDIPTEGTYIIHYPGPNKPWNNLAFKMAKQWWSDCLQTRVFESFFKNNVNSFFNYYMNTNKPCSFEDCLFACKGKNIYLFGAGVLCRVAISVLKQYNLKVSNILVTDSKDEKQLTLCEIPIVSFSCINQKDNSIVLVTAYKDFVTIAKTLYKEGFKEVWNMGVFLVDIAVGRDKR